MRALPTWMESGDWREKDEKLQVFFKKGSSIRGGGGGGGGGGGQNESNILFY